MWLPTRYRQLSFFKRRKILHNIIELEENQTVLQIKRFSIGKRYGSKDLRSQRVNLLTNHSVVRNHRFRFCLKANLDFISFTNSVSSCISLVRNFSSSFSTGNNSSHVAYHIHIFSLFTLIFNKI